MAEKLEELPIYGRVMAFCGAVNAILDKPGLRRNRILRAQIEEANDSISANMEEGFEQGTDRAFATYLSYSKASLAEVIARLKSAENKRYITAQELRCRVAMGEELGKMLGGFIKYLRRCDWKDRGRFGSQPPDSD